MSAHARTSSRAAETSTELAPLWRAELIGIATVRGLWLGAGAATLAQPLAALLVAEGGGVRGTASLSAAAGTSALLGALGFGIWAASLSASDYVHGTTTVRVATTPGRRRLVAGRLGAVASVAVAGGLVAVLLSLLLLTVTQPPHGRPLGDAATLFAVPLVYGCVAAAAAAVGLLVRSPVWAVGLVVAALLLPQAAAGLWGGLQRWVVGAAPGNVVTAWVRAAGLAPEQRFPGGAPAATLALLVVTAVVVAAAGVVVSRRDGG